MKRNDCILVVAILVLSAISFIGFHMYSNNKGTLVEVSVDGEVYAVLSLDEDQELSIDEHNYVVIENGVVDMIEADCPDELCVHQNAIDSIGESIICLPNKVIVTIIGSSDEEQQDEYDVTIN